MTRLLVVLLLAFGIALLGAQEGARATPLYAVRAGHSCATCHIEPSGWSEPSFFERECTLSCKSCHVSPGGGGLRTPAGRYYGMEVLPTWGLRPGDHGDPSRYRPEGHPEEGRYRLWEGFSGWWPGPVSPKQVSDRYGFLDPTPMFDAGVDLRGMVFAPLLDENRPLQAFPMQADVYGAVRPDEHFVFVGSFGLQGRRDGGLDDGKLGKGVARADPLSYLTSRELYVMADHLPFGGYVRAGRFPVTYGWRLPDHTTFTRRNLAFDEDRSVFGVEAGVVQNYAYAHLQVFRQGFEGWFGETLPVGDGAAFSFGWRDLGWQVGFSSEVLRRRFPNAPASRFSDGGTYKSGLQWGLNLYPFVYLGELDWRLTDPHEAGNDELAHALAAFHELNWLVVRGLNGKLKYEWMDPSLRFKDDQFHRASVGVEWHPFLFTHLELDYRYAWKTYDVVATASHEALLMVHFWY